MQNSLILDLRKMALRVIRHMYLLGSWEHTDMQLLSML